jgi:hypothetical protein
MEQMQPLTECRSSRCPRELVDERCIEVRGVDG